MTGFKFLVLSIFSTKSMSFTNSFKNYTVILKLFKKCQNRCQNHSLWPNSDFFESTFLANGPYIVHFGHFACWFGFRLTVFW